MIDTIEIHYLTYNTNVKILPFIQKYIDDFTEIDWCNLSENPIIFELDYQQMKKNNQNFYEDLIKEVMKPERVFKDPNYDYIEELFGD